MIKIFRTSDEKCLRTSANKILRYDVPEIVYANSKYGLLYNFYAVSGTGGLSIAPVGWHVPTNAEWITLNTYVGGTSVAGGKLKETGLTYWNTPNTGADNAYSFNARGSGIRAVGGLFGSLKVFGYLWTATEFSVYGYIMPINNDSAASATNSVQNKWYGNAVRLIKDDSTDSGTMVGTDGLTYRTVKIGSQVWMSENYKTTKYRDGSDIPNVTDNTTWTGLTTGAWCAYNNDNLNI